MNLISAIREFETKFKMHTPSDTPIVSITLDESAFDTLVSELNGHYPYSEMEAMDNKIVKFTLLGISFNKWVNVEIEK